MNVHALAEAGDFTGIFLAVTSGVFPDLDLMAFTAFNNGHWGDQGLPDFVHIIDIAHLQVP